MGWLALGRPGRWASTGVVGPPIVGVFSSEGVRGERADRVDHEPEQSVELGPLVLRHKRVGIAEVLLVELLHERGEENLDGLGRFLALTDVFQIAGLLCLQFFEVGSGDPRDQGYFFFREGTAVR